MQTVGLSVILGADFSSAEEAMAKFRQSVDRLASETAKAFSSMAGTAAQIGNSFKPVSDGARNATQVVINESKARIQIDNEETQAALNASRLKIQAQREEAAAQRVATQAKKAEKDEYGQLVAANNQVVRAYYNAAAAAIRMKDSTEETAAKLKEMAAAALAGQEQLKSIEAGAGRFQRNVGNYSGAVTFLNQSVAQLTGEIPNFFQSMRVGFMAIGNNIQPLVQGIKALQAENVKLAASGEKTRSVVGTLAKSFFGWQTILLVGVGLISRYGAQLVDWATGADKAKAAAEALKKQQEDWKNITDQSNKTAADQIAKIQTLNIIITDQSQTMAKRTQAYEEAKKLYPSYLSNMTKDKALNGGIAEVINKDLIPAIMAAATARAYEGKISEQVTKKIELEEKRKVAAYKRSQAETDVLTARLNARGNNQRAAGSAGVGAANGMGDNATLVAANKRYAEAGKEVFELDEQIRIARGNITGLANDYKTAAEKMGQLTSQGIDPLTHKTKQTKEHIDALTKSGNTLNDKLAEIDAKLKAGLLTTFDATKDKISATGQYLDSLFKNGGSREDINKYIDLLKMLNYQLSAMGGVSLEAAKGLSGLSASASFSKDFHEATKGAQDRAAGLYDQIGIAGDLNKSKDRRKDEAKDQVKYEQELNREFNKSYSIMNKLVGGPLDSFTNALFNGDNAMEALGNSIKDIVKNLAEAVIKAGIFSAIMSAINPTSFAAGGGFLGVLGKLLPFASGGIVTGPTPALVGEAGPEAIIPLNKLGSIMGNRDLNVNVRGDIRGRNIKLANDRESEFQKR